EQAAGAGVSEAVFLAGPGHDRLARLEALFLTVHDDQCEALEDEIDLVLVSVGVRLLLLARLETIEIELRARRRRQRDLRHLVRTKLRPVLDPDLHVRSPIISLSPRRATRLGSPRHDHFTLASLAHPRPRPLRRTASPRTATRDTPRLAPPRSSHSRLPRSSPRPAPPQARPTSPPHARPASAPAPPTPAT